MDSSKSNDVIPEVYAARTDVGKVREHNEDSFIASSPLFAVADGMGGHESGEVASEIAIDTISRLAPHCPDGDGLAAAVHSANNAILKGVEDGVGRAGMGTTLTAAQIFDDQLLIAQVGDSRAYLLHDGALQRITRDHSLVADLVAQGRLTEEEARTHPQRSVITRALGSDVLVEPDIYILRLHPGDRIMLCSDGLCGLVPDQAIETILASHADPADCCDALVNEALAAGGTDNVTVIVVDPFKKMDEESLPAQGSKKPRKKPFLVPIIWAVAVIAVIAACVGGVYAYAQNSYYIILEDDYVNVYRGLPDGFGPIELSWLEQETDITSAELAPSTVARLESGVAVGSLEEAQATIDTYRGDTTTADSGTNG